MGEIRWKKLRLPIAIAAISTIAITGAIVWILTEPVIYCYDENTPDQVEWGAENCLPSEGAIKGEKL